MAITELLSPNGPSTDTLASVSFTATDTRLLSHLSSPQETEQLLTPEIITAFSKLNFEKAWQFRKATGNEAHPDSNQKFSDLNAETRDFIRHLNTGKLAYSVAFITREGLQAMIELGEQGQSLQSLNDDPGALLPDPQTGFSVQEALARLHHQNWLNLNARLERVHPGNYEWGEFAPSAKHLQESDRGQVDGDCRALAALSSEQKELLLALAQPGDGIHFFHSDIPLTVRSQNPVYAPDTGWQYSDRQDASELLPAVGQVLLNNSCQTFFQAQPIFDELELSSRDRKVVRSLLYTNDGVRRQESACIEVGRLLRAAAQEGLKLAGTPAAIAEMLAPKLIERGLEIPSAFPAEPVAVPVENHPLSVHPSFDVAFSPEFYSQWTEMNYRAVHRVNHGFEAGRPQLENGNSVEDLPPARQFFRNQIAGKKLAILQSYRSETLDEIRALGQRMIDHGITGVRNTPQSISRGIQLCSGELAQLPSELLEKMTFELRRATVAAHDFSQLLPQSHRIKRWSPAKQAEFLSDKVDYKKWQTDIVNTYAMTLTVGALNESEYATLRKACVQHQDLTSSFEKY